jgi:hypothetical protein
MGGSAPLGSVLGGSSPLNPLIGAASPLGPLLCNLVESPADTGETAAMPPPDVVYEPSPSDEGALLTYSPPQVPQDMPQNARVAADDDRVARFVADGDEPQEDGPVAGLADDETRIRDESDAGGDNLADADALLAAAVAASSSVRTQFAPDPLPDAAVVTSPLSVQVARAVQALQVSQPVPASMPGGPAPAPAADPHAQSQLMAQAVYSLIADAQVRDRSVVDLLKFA